MIVITLTKVPNSLRGDLTRWCQEVQTGVYVGNFSARIRDLLWIKIKENIGQGEATLIYNTNNELGYTFKTTRKSYKVIDFEGVPLMMHLRDSNLKRKSGYSKAARAHRAKIMAQKRLKDSIKEKRNSIVAIDIETTGLDLEKDSIISIGAVKVENNSKHDYYSLIKGIEEIPDEISELTGIGIDELNKDGEDIYKVLKVLYGVLDDAIIIGYNLNFDLNFLNREYEQYTELKLVNKVIDLLPIVKKQCRFLDNYRLETVLQYFGIENSHPHNALEDVKACIELYEKLIKNK
ncbi:type I-E CRISPR-associated endoribonuclease Cas2e [Ligilactobacillus salivarius]|uniref:type I-E CRISPR-associated endoribonuclease Cas2e n=1 Tax=Ligilactobacillus salivarius TaxID=1624 RepID=UPI0033152CF7